MQKGDIVDMIYQDRHGKFTRRRVRIITVRKKSICAYCFTRHQVRTFATECILSSQKVLRSA